MDTTRDARRLPVTAARRVRDAVPVLGCAVLTWLAVKTPWSPLPPAVIVATGLLGSAAMWPRRRHSLLAAVAGAAAFAWGGNPGPWLVGLYSAARHAPRRQIWASGAAAWVGYLIWSWLDVGRLRWDDFVFPPLAVGLVILIGVHLATRDALLVSTRERAERAETERLLREEQARTAERTRIAREMHDVLAHKVSLIALYAGVLELHAAGDAHLRESTALIRVTAREALGELRDVLGVLRTEPAGHSTAGAQPGTPFPDLEALVHSSNSAGQPVELHDAAGPLPPGTARVVYRVVQEGLTNAHKHAPGAPTTVSVDRAGDGNITVTVHNEPGAAPMDLPGSGSGLVGLAERIRLVGGALHSGPAGHEGGWRLHAAVPWLDHRIQDRSVQDRSEDPPGTAADGPSTPAMPARPAGMDAS